VKVTLAPTTGEPVLVSKVPVNTSASCGDPNVATKIRDVGVGDGDGVVNPEELELIVFDEVTVQELPQSCCISWLFRFFHTAVPPYLQIVKGRLSSCISINLQICTNSCLQF
jgi:hypothetical protein